MAADVTRGLSSAGRCHESAPRTRVRATCGRRRARRRRERRDAPSLARLGCPQARARPSFSEPRNAGAPRKHGGITMLQARFEEASGVLLVTPLTRELDAEVAPELRRAMVE